MTHNFRAYSPQCTVSFAVALTLGGLFLAGGKPASADGQFVYDNHGTPKSIVYIDPNSAAYFTPGQTTSASSYSNYPATASASTSSGSASGSVNLYFYWVNSDGKSPYPTTSYNATTNGSVSGAASPSGASASSSASGYGSKSTLPDYNQSSAQQYKMANPGLAPSVSVSVSASTSAGPDNTADPSKENYGNPTAADSSGSSSATIDHSVLS